MQIHEDHVSDVGHWIAPKYPFSVRHEYGCMLSDPVDRFLLAMTVISKPPRESERTPVAEEKEDS